MRGEVIILDMQCCSGKQAHFMCINRSCEMKNCYVCADPHDTCKQNHESCSLINLSYLLKKAQLDNNPRNRTNRYDKLMPIYEKSKVIAQTISNALASYHTTWQISQMLEDKKQLTPDDKDKIAKFMSDRKIEQAQENVYHKIERQVEEFQVLISDFQLGMKELRNKQIQELRKKLEREEKMRFTQAPSEELIGAKSAVKKSAVKQQIPRKSTEEASPAKTMKLSAVNTEMKSRLPQSNQKDKQKAEKSDKKKQFVQKAKSSSVRQKPTQIQQKLTNFIKNHIPKAPLFSKITNQIDTINIFFFQKIESAKLLYRASQNDYSVAKFHEKCDGHKDTLTLILTEYDKVIGGFTTLPWRSGGGEWYQDKQGQSFIFNVTSGQKYPLLDKQKAIWCSKTYGPSFGHPDLQIADKAFHNSNSCANFPTCYNNGNYVNSAGSAQLFCGSKNGHFRIRQWEVFELTFP